MVNCVLRPKEPTFIMEAFLVATGIVALAEMGDKTQLLSLVLAARFRKPWPIVLGIFVATIVNHALAGAVGAFVTQWLGPTTLRWLLGGSFIAMAAWMLIPDKLDEDDARRALPLRRVRHHRRGLLPGRDGRQDPDRHRDAGGALRARLLRRGRRHHLGMMLANAPVVFLGERIMRRVPIKLVHLSAAISWCWSS
jgi:putative Ca2+/H+ antiporter (TMEM165/GDT1 family)